MNCSGIVYTPLRRSLINIIYFIFMNIPLKVSHSSINIFTLKPNELSKRILSYIDGMAGDKTMDMFISSMRPMFCSIMHYGEFCMKHIAKSGLDNMDQMEATAVWQENPEDIIFFNCQRSNVQRNISISNAKKHFLISYLTQKQILNFNIAPSCVTLFQMYAPLYIGLYTNDQSFQKDLIKFTYHYLRDNMPENMTSISTVEMLHILEILSVNIHSNFCHDLQHYSGIFRTSYMLFQQWNIFNKIISCYVYPALCLFGVCSNTIVFYNYAIKMRRKEELSSHADLAFVSFVDIILVALLTLPSSLKCWQPHIFVHSEWFCSGQAFTRGVLHTISSWSVAIMGLNSLTCSIEASGSRRNKIHLNIFKHIAISLFAVALNLPRLFYIRIVNRAGLFSVCYHIRMGWITPSYSHIFYTMLHVLVPFVICMLKNVSLLIRNASTNSKMLTPNARNSGTRCATKQNRIYLTVVLAVCARFSIFSLPSILAFVLKTATPHRYLKNMLFTDTEKAIYLYIPRVAHMFVVLNFSINLYFLMFVRQDIKFCPFR